MATRQERILEVLQQHHPMQGVMASPSHWAYHKGWFAHCGTSYEDQKGCGWDSKPETYPDKITARRAALTHLASEIDKEI